MNALLSSLAGLPTWAVEGMVGLIAASVRLMRATNDDEREAALMDAAEAAKRAADARKFGASE